MTNPNEEDAVTNLIECRGVGKTYWQEGDFAVPIFHDLDLSLATGEFLSIVGPSGSGKSTLLHLMACLLYTSPSPRDATLSRMPSSA